MDLVPYIFHETQEPGSQLCAQHSLNNLLQEPCYTEVDLADVARKLDEAEAASTYAAPPTKSYNYDDTGYFSISVLEKALQVWDLTLVRWRGEAMKPYVNHPEDQAAFILNLANHWFTLRRFGNKTRWYNLNSFLSAPEWISPTYLQMVLAQAEAEGYSVFAVRKAGVGAGESAGQDPGEGTGWEDGGIGVLTETPADLMAIELGAVHDRRGSYGTQQPQPNGTNTGSEDDNGGPGPSAVANRARNVSSASTQPPSYSANHSPTAGPSNAEGLSPPSTSYLAGTGRQRRRQEDLMSDFVEEQDFIGSQPSSRSRTPRVRPTIPQEDVFADDAAMLNELDHDELDHDEELDDDDEYPTSRSYAHYAAMNAYTGPTDFTRQSRSYDDEDEALQAALKASMVGLPEDFVMPELKPIQPPPVLRSKPTPAAEPVPEPEAAPPVEESIPIEEDDDIEEDDGDEPAKSLSPEEIRAARLARFQ